MIAAWKVKIDKEMRHLKWKYKLLKVKWVLLFVLPILLIAIAYQVAKQYLCLKMREIQTEIIEEEPGQGACKTDEP